MRLIDAAVADIRHLPCEGGVEADVRLVFAERAGAPAQERTVRGRTPLVDPKDRPVHVRLVADALQAALRGGHGAVF